MAFNRSVNAAARASMDGGRRPMVAEAGGGAGTPGATGTSSQQASILGDLARLSTP